MRENGKEKTGLLSRHLKTIKKTSHECLTSVKSCTFKQKTSTHDNFESNVTFQESVTSRDVSESCGAGAGKSRQELNYFTHALLESELNSLHHNCHVKCGIYRAHF